jgi:misacylated tRNA(Ala) deacylase
MKAMYLEDCYLRDFSASVESVNGNCVVLDRTAFYPQSGGQPSDLGVLTRSGEAFALTGVLPSDEGIVHCLDGEGLKVGDEVCGSVDWERRYRLMRGHTACHVLSAVIFKETGAKITGNQIDLSRSRVDFSLDKFDKSQMSGYVDQANQIMRQNREVKTCILPRSKALEIPDLVRLAMDVPDRDMIRVVEIDGVDIQACGGTHVRSTGEVGEIRMAKAENKGKSNRRVYFELVG